MNKHKIDIKASRLFPWHFLFLAVIVLVVGLALLTESTILSIILIIGSVFILSGYVGTEIDKAGKTYLEYTSFFFLKNGKKIKYEGIEKIYINTSKIKQQIYTAHTSQSSVFTNIEFNGYLKLEEGTKIHLLSKRKKAALLQALGKVSAFLNVPVEDNTVK